MAKKIFILSFLACLCALPACNDYEDLLSNETTFQETSSNPILEKAKEAYESCYPSSSRGSFVSFNESGIVPITMLSSRATIPDTILYIINESEGNGFVALTGGSRPEVLAVSDNGTVTDIDDIDNPGLKMFFNAAMDYAGVQSQRNYSDGQLDPIPYFKTNIEIEDFAYCPTRCLTSWGQQYPEGLYCPNNLSGCTITATAQALSYFELPTSLSTTFPSAIKASVNLDWKGMKEYVKSLSWTEYNSPHKALPIQKEFEDDLGHLCRELGYRMNAKYKVGATGAGLDSMAIVVRQLCPDLSVSNRIYGAPVAKKDLHNGIIIMQGSQYASDSQANDIFHSCIQGGCIAHAIVVDGYKYEKRKHNFYVLNDNGEYVYSEELSYYEIIDLQHLNWGWRGQCNGYFNLGVFKTDSPVVPDTDTNPPYYNFTHAFSYFLITPKN